MIQISDKIETIAKHGKHTAKEYAVLCQLHHTLPGLAPVPVECHEDVLITEKVQDATRIDPNGDDVLALSGAMRRAAESLARLHAADTIGLEEVLPQYKRSIKDYISESLREHLTDWANKTLPVSLIAEIQEKLPQRLQQVKLSSSYGLMHGDFEFQNLLIIGGNKVMIFDFEDAALGFQIDDLALFSSKLLLLNAVSTKPNPTLVDLENTFVTAYSEKRPFDRVTFEILRFVYLLRVRFTENVSLWNYEGVKNFYKRRKYEKFIRAEWEKLLRGHDI